MIKVIGRAVFQRPKQPERDFKRDEWVRREVKDQRGHGPRETRQRKSGEQGDGQARAAARDSDEPGDGVVAPRMPATGTAKEVTGRKAECND